MLKTLAAKAAPAIAKPLLLAALTVCPPADQAPHADMQFSAKKTLYVTGVPSDVLAQGMRNKLNSTFASDSRWRIEGASAPSISIRTQTFFTIKQDENENKCIDISSVTIYMEDDPTIYIADTAEKSKCRFSVVKAHEERHVNVDFQTVNEYIPKVKMAVLRYLAAYTTQGPYTPQQAEQVTDTISKEVGSVADQAMAEMFAEDSRRQAKLDTPENYRREQSLCPSDFAQPASAQQPASPPTATAPAAASEPDDDGVPPPAPVAPPDLN